jgi:hypothetical protein
MDNSLGHNAFYVNPYKVKITSLNETKLDFICKFRPETVS